MRFKNRAIRQFAVVPLEEPSVLGLTEYVALFHADGTPVDFSGEGDFAPRGAFTKTDTLAGVLDWINNSTSGYLLHLRTGASSTASTAAIGIGTDQGVGTGLLVSHKNSGTGINLGVNPGAGVGMTVNGRSTSSPIKVNHFAGGGAVALQANTGANFNDGTTTSGSTTFTSATAAFVPGDVGQTLTQLTSRGLSTDPAGAIPAGTTIATYVSPTQVTMSQPAGATASTILFAVGGRVIPATQPLFQVLNESAAALLTVTKGGLTLVGGAVGEVPLKVTGAAGQTANIFAAFLSGNGTAALSVAANGGVTIPFGTFPSNAGNVNTAAVTSTTWSSNPAVRVTRSATDKTGDLLVACEASSTTPLTRINKEGFLMTRKVAAPPDADIATSEASIWLDPTPGSSKLMIKGKNSSGTVITGSVALA